MAKHNRAESPKMDLSALPLGEGFYTEDYERIGPGTPAEQLKGIRQGLEAAKYEYGSKALQKAALNDRRLELLQDISRVNAKLNHGNETALRARHADQLQLQLAQLQQELGQVVQQYEAVSKDLVTAYELGWEQRDIQYMAKRVNSLIGEVALAGLNVPQPEDITDLQSVGDYARAVLSKLSQPNTHLSMDGFQLQSLQDIGMELVDITQNAGYVPDLPRRDSDAYNKSTQPGWGPVKTGILATTTAVVFSVGYQALSPKTAEAAVVREYQTDVPHESWRDLPLELLEKTAARGFMNTGIFKGFEEVSIEYDGKTIQLELAVFERAAFNIHPETGEWVPARVVAETERLEGRDPNTIDKETEAKTRYVTVDINTLIQNPGVLSEAWKSQPGAGGVFFMDKEGKGWNVPKAFVEHMLQSPNWLELYGLPIGDFKKMNNGEGVFDAQNFERARLELHPENEPPYNVLSGFAGIEYLNALMGHSPEFPKEIEEPEDPIEQEEQQEQPTDDDEAEEPSTDEEEKPTQPDEQRDPDTVDQGELDDEEREEATEDDTATENENINLGVEEVVAEFQERAYYNINLTNGVTIERDSEDNVTNITFSADFRDNMISFYEISINGLGPEYQNLSPDEIKAITNKLWGQDSEEMIEALEEAEITEVLVDGNTQQKGLLINSGEFAGNDKTVWNDMAKGAFEIVKLYVIPEGLIGQDPNTNRETIGSESGVGIDDEYVLAEEGEDPYKVQEIQFSVDGGKTWQTIEAGEELPPNAELRQIVPVPEGDPKLLGDQTEPGYNTLATDDESEDERGCETPDEILKAHVTEEYCPRLPGDRGPLSAALRRAGIINEGEVVTQIQSSGETWQMVVGSEIFSHPSEGYIPKAKDILVYRPGEEGVWYRLQGPNIESDMVLVLLPPSDLHSVRVVVNHMSDKGVHYKRARDASGVILAYGWDSYEEGWDRISYDDDSAANLEPDQVVGE